MLEIQKNRLYEASRLKAHGASKEEIEALKNAGKQLFRPAFIGGKRKKRSADGPAEDAERENAGFKRPH